eukprot:TRINITY_DN25867_c0_g1_i1.p1 TRINITY_DN25867_c0_g1~~TRINITY_DN25867_c0_g1_i1.p1  ORF type:complete len:319 (+),score=44.39 TRINITY_DN25867_c0_g1_i1:52-1008(+)
MDHRGDAEEGLSQRLSNLLRHKGPRRNVPVRPDGLAPLSAVLAALNCSREDVESVVQSSRKRGHPRFETGTYNKVTWIRATGSHSIRAVRAELLSIDVRTCLENNPPMNPCLGGKSQSSSRSQTSDISSPYLGGKGQSSFPSRTSDTTPPCPGGKGQGSFSSQTCDITPSCLDSKDQSSFPSPASDIPPPPPLGRESSYMEDHIVSSSLQSNNRSSAPSPKHPPPRLKKSVPIATESHAPMPQGRSLHVDQHSPESEIERHKLREKELEEEVEKLRTQVAMLNEKVAELETRNKELSFAAQRTSGQSFKSSYPQTFDV